MWPYLLVYGAVALGIAIFAGPVFSAPDQRFAARALLIAPIWPLALVYGVLYAVYWIFRYGWNFFLDLLDLAEWRKRKYN